MRLMVAVLFLMTISLAAPAATPPELVGDWKGVTRTGSGQPAMTVVFHIGRDHVVADSPDQGGFDLPANAEVAAGAVKLAIPLVGATFSGTLSADGKTLDGVLYQGANSLRLTLRQTSTVATLPPPPRPAPAEIRGDWEGGLKTANGLVTILYHLTDKPSADILAQGVTGLPVEVEKIGEVWKVTVLDAIFAGKLSADGKSIVGAMRQGDQTGQMTLIRK
jgi:hypothetical protein